MGRATRWLKNLFGIKRDNKKEISNPPPSSSSNSLCHNPATIPPNISPAEAAWLKSFYSETEKEQSKHAIAVAAAADAAVAAAQAAVAVVRLTSDGRDSMYGGGHEKLAAFKIQTVFRGYLARKALKALKALVKLQALVRGYLVRKQATATLRSMQALIRAQATVRAHKSRAFRIQTQARRSTEESGRSEYTAKIHRRRLSSSSFDATMNNTNSTDGSPKIVEMDTARPKSRSRRNTNTSSISDFRDDPSFHFNDSDWGFTWEECRFSTAQSTPRFANSCSCGGGSVVVTPKTVCTDNNNNKKLLYANFPNYMANTRSFKAKLRSQSAPKQRPEQGLKKTRVSLNEMMEGRISLSGVKMQRSCSQIQEHINFKNAVMGRLDKSMEFARERKC